MFKKYRFSCCSWLLQNACVTVGTNIICYSVCLVIVDANAQLFLLFSNVGSFNKYSEVMMWSNDVWDIMRVGSADVSCSQSRFTNELSRVDTAYWLITTYATTSTQQRSQTALWQSVATAAISVVVRFVGRRFKSMTNLGVDACQQKLSYANILLECTREPS